MGLAEEWENFMRFDKNDDAEVDLEEWLLQLAPPSEDNAQVKRWKKEFEDADLGKDGMLDWNEWRVMLFHEQVWIATVACHAIDETAAPCALPLYRKTTHKRCPLRCNES